MSGGSGRRFPYRIYALVLVIILVLAVWPLASVLLASGIAEANGCRLDEGSVHPCLVGGQDWGSMLYTLGVLGWLMLGTLPLGAGAVIIWLVILIIHRLAWGRASAKEIGQ